jgi:hypothetical protein
MRKLKALGLALVAIGAISAVAAASASANYNIASATGGSISGSQTVTNEFVTTIGTVKCTTATFAASQATETAETLTVLPTYSGCTLAGIKVNITTNKCHYLFTKPTTTEPTGTTHAIVHVKCPTAGTNAFILIKDTAGAGCEVKVAEQETKGTVMMTNVPEHISIVEGKEVLTKDKVSVESNVEGIAATWTAGCPNTGGKAGGDAKGKYLGSVEVEGKSGETKVGIKVT